LGGLESVQDAIDDLQEDGTSTATHRVVSTAEYSRPLEFGRGPIQAPEGSAIPIETDSGTIFRKSVSGHPPYPFFRPAIREARNNMEALVQRHQGLRFEDFETADALILAIAESLREQMQNNVRAQGSNRSPGTHPMHPQVETGNLLNGLRRERI